MAWNDTLLEDAFRIEGHKPVVFEVAGGEVLIGSSCLEEGDAEVNVSAIAIMDGRSVSIGLECIF